MAQFWALRHALLLGQCDWGSLDPQADGVPGAAQEACLLDPPAQPEALAKVCSPSTTFKEPTAWPWCIEPPGVWARDFCLDLASTARGHRHHDGFRDGRSSERSQRPSRGLAWPRGVGFKEFDGIEGGVAPSSTGFWLSLARAHSRWPCPERWTAGGAPAHVEIALGGGDQAIASRCGVTVLRPSTVGSRKSSMLRLVPFEGGVPGSCHCAVE